MDGGSELGDLKSLRYQILVPNVSKMGSKRLLLLLCLALFVLCSIPTYPTHANTALVLTTTKQAVDIFAHLEPIAVASVKRIVNLATIPTNAPVCDAVSIPDSKYIAMSYGKDEIQVWNLETTRAHALLRGHTDTICTMLVSPDGKLLASASLDTTIRLWEIASSRLLAVIHRGRKEGSIFTDGFAFAPDGKLLVSVAGGFVQGWKIPSGEKLFELSDPAGDLVYTFALSPNGRIAAAGGRDGKIRIWDLTTKRRIAELSEYASALAFSPNGFILVSATGNLPSTGNRVVFWNATTWTALKSSPERQASTFHIEFSPNGKFVAASSYSGETIDVWQVNTRKHLVTLNAGAAPGGVVFTSDEAIMASGEFENQADTRGAIQLWNTATWELVNTLRGHASGPINSLYFDQHDTLLISGSGDGTVKLWGIPPKSS